MTRSALCRPAPLVAAALLAAAALPARAADLWAPLGPSGGTAAAVAVDPADGNTVYAGSLRAGVWKSSNGGRAWRSAGLDGGVSRLAVAATAERPAALYVLATHPGGTDLDVSLDDGATWNALGEGLPRTGTHLSLDPASLSTVYAATEGGGIYRLERTNP